MALKAGNKGIKEVGTGLVMDQEGVLSLDPDINTAADMICSETTAGDYSLKATVDSEGAVTYSWTAIE